MRGGITDTAKKSGYNVILINTDEERAAEVDAVRVLLDKRVDGLIVAPASSVETSHLQQVRESGRPLVLLDRAAAGVDVETFAVDMGSISYESTKHLIEAGHRRIAFVSTVRTEAPMLQGWSWTLRRSQTAWTESTVRSMKRASPHPTDLVRLNAGDADSIMRITQDLLSGPDAATAIIASDGLIALSVVEAIQLSGRSVPQDVSLLMYDDFAWTASPLPPAHRHLTARLRHGNCRSLSADQAD